MKKSTVAARRRQSSIINWSFCMPLQVKTMLVLLLLLLPALLYTLDSRPVYKIQEVRIAETAREMQASGDWLVPHYNGELRLQKPPLPYWLTGLSYKIFGVNAM